MEKRKEKQKASDKKGKKEKGMERKEEEKGKGIEWGCILGKMTSARRNEGACYQERKTIFDPCKKTSSLIFSSNID